MNNNELCKCGKVGAVSCPNDERCGEPDTQLPAEWFLPADKVAFMKDVVAKLRASNRSDYESGEFDSFNHKQEGRYGAFEEVLQWLNPATEYANKLNEERLATEDKIDKALHAERNKMQQRFTESETEYANKLHLVEQENTQLKCELDTAIRANENLTSRMGSWQQQLREEQKKKEAVTSLLEKVKARHEGGLLPDRLLYIEIKKFFRWNKINYHTT